MDYKKYHRDKTYQENESLFKNIFTKRFFVASKFINYPGRVLDIGTSTGTMLDIFKENGWETWGVEPSETATIAKDKGHNISNIYFEAAKLPKDYFDLVIMNHTLEHIKDPLQTLKKINLVLKKGGMAYVDVPNAGGIASKIMGDKWPYRLPLEHEWQFTRKSLSELFVKAGFKVVHFESRSGLFEFGHPLKELFESLITGKKRFFTNLITFPYAFIVTIFNTGDSMSILGKKL